MERALREQRPRRRFNAETAESAETCTNSAISAGSALKPSSAGSALQTSSAGSASSARLRDRNAVLVLRQPHRERLQGRIQFATDCNIPDATKDVLEIALELEHVGELFGPRHVQSPILLGADGVVADFSLQRVAQCSGHLRASQMLAGDAHRLPTELRTSFEDAVGASPDVLRG